ncbi:hypothetical protein B0E37_05410 [Streptomyces sp. MH192]|nr:hypothetical protein [Streptomyces sp. MH192]
MQPPLGRGTGVPAQPGSGQGVLGLVECGGQGRPAGRGPGGAGGVEESGDGLVHAGDRRPLPVEAVAEPCAARGGARRGQQKAQTQQPARAGEVEERALPARLRQHHPGAEGGGHQELGAHGGGDRPDGADRTPEQSQKGEQQGQGHRTGVPSGVTAGQQPGRTGQRGQTEPADRGASAAGAVVDAGEHGAERGDDSQGGASGEHAREQQWTRGQRPAHHRAPGDGPALGAQCVGDPERQARGGAVHGAPVGRGREGLRATVAGLFGVSYGTAGTGGNGNAGVSPA